MLTINECRQFAQDFAKNELGRELDIPVVEFNRMKNSGAFRYSGYILHEKSREGAVDIRIKLNEEVAEEELKGIIKHEVIHWYCYVSYLDYHDGDKDFESLLNKHNAPSTYFGTKGQAQSQFIQEKVMNDKMKLNGFKGTQFKKADAVAIYELVRENNKHLMDLGIELHHIEKPYTVYYNGELLGYVFDLIHNQWHMIDAEGRSYEKGCYKTRKDATTESIFQFEQNESKVI